MGGSKTNSARKERESSKDGPRGQRDGSRDEKLGIQAASPREEKTALAESGYQPQTGLNQKPSPRIKVKAILENNDSDSDDFAAECGNMGSKKDQIKQNKIIRGGKGYMLEDDRQGFE